MKTSTLTQLAIRTLAGLALAASGGLLLTLSFPPYDLWPLVFAGFVPTVVAQHRVMPRFLSGLAYGVGFGTFYWGYFGPMFADLVWFMAWLPLIVAVVATLLSGGDRAFNERTDYRWFVLNGAVVWVGIEAIRGIAPVIGTGGSVAFALYSQPWFIQPVSIFGIFGLGLLIMLVNYSLALWCISWLDRRWRRDAASLPVGTGLARRRFVGVAAVVVLWSGLSFALLGEASVPGSSVRIAAIQPGYSATQEEGTAKLLAQTRQAAAEGAQFVVWPEGALNFDPRARQTEEFRRVVRETGTYLAIGYGLGLPEGVRNEMVIVGPDGRFLGVYGKDHPVVWMGESSLTRGSYPVYHTPLGTLGTIICYDLNFTDTARKFASNGAQLLAVGSNDWSSMAPKQYTNLVMRAVENRVTLVKADGKYDSAVIDPTGFILSRQASLTPQQVTLVVDVPLGRADAPLIRLGDWIGWLSIAGVVFFTGFGILNKRRASRARSAATEEGLTSTTVAGSAPGLGVR